MTAWVVYIVECRNRSYYTGMTNDLARRIKEHKRGLGGRYTRSFGVRAVVYTEPCRSRGRALRREAAIKRLTRRQKQKLASA